MKRKKDKSSVYKGIRKHVPRPTKVEKDRRREIRNREDEREMEEHEGGRRQARGAKEGDE